MDEYTTVKFELEDMTLEFFRPELERMFPNFDVWEVSPQRFVYRKTARGTTEALDLHVTQHRPNALRGMLIYPGKFTALADSILGWVEQSYASQPATRTLTPEELVEFLKGYAKQKPEWKRIVREWWVNGGKDIITQEKLAEVLGVSLRTLSRDLNPKE